MPQKSGSKLVKGYAVCTKGEMNAAASIHSCFKFE